MERSNQHFSVLFAFQFPTHTESTPLIGNMEQQSFADTLIVVGYSSVGLLTHAPFFLYSRFPPILISCLQNAANWPFQRFAIDVS